eukprot:g1469.t1
MMGLTGASHDHAYCLFPPNTTLDAQKGKQCSGLCNIGMAYALCAAELVLAPVVPSNTARGGGCLSPVIAAVAQQVVPETRPFVVLVAAHANLLSSSMFLTGSSGNQLVADAASDVFGLDYDWATWVKYAAVPGLVGFALLPLFLQLLLRPPAMDSEKVVQLAEDQLRQLGPLSREEKMLVVTFVVLLLLWATEKQTGLETAAVALCGVGALTACGVLSVAQVVSNHKAWNQLIFLGGFLTFVNSLKVLHVISWFERALEQLLVHVKGKVLICVVLALLYFVS